MKLSFCGRVLAVMAVFGNSGCESPPADLSDIKLSLSFPDALTDGVGKPLLDANGNQILPLDAADNFPLRVTVTTPYSNALQGQLSVHLTLSGEVGATVSGSMPGADTMLGLGVDIPDASISVAAAPTAYAGTATLNAPGPGVVTIQAELAGSFSAASIHLQDASIMAMGAVTPTDWSGTAPRFEVCAETSAIKGSVVLVSDDPANLGQTTGTTDMPPTGTLVLGPCIAPALTKPGPGVSHADFVLSAIPPFPLQAIFTGRLNEDPNKNDVWAAPITISPQAMSQVAISFGAPQLVQGVTEPGGNLYELTANAVLNGTQQPIQGLNISFSAMGSGSTAPTLVPSSGATDINGNLKTRLSVPFGGQVVAAATGGGAFVEVSVPAQPLPIALSFVGAPVPVDTVMGAVVYQVTVKASQTNIVMPPPAAGMTVTFGVEGGANMPVPLSAVTAQDGTAITNVLVVNNTQVFLTATGGGALAGLAIPEMAPQAATLTLTASPTGMMLANGAVFLLTATASGPNGTLPNVNISFSAISASTFTLSPPMVTTAANGTALAYAVVPYDTQALFFATGGGGGAPPVVATAPQAPFLLTAKPGSSGNKIGDNSVFTVTAQLTQANVGVAGVKLQFTILASSAPMNQTQPSLSEASATTDFSGTATVTVLLVSGATASIGVSGPDVLSMPILIMN